MKIFKFWRVERSDFEFRGQSFPIKCYGGSNLSFEEASAKALEKIERVKLRISGAKGKAAETSYEAEIREEPLHFIDDANVVTRNRYGARILNCRDMMILDIDRPRASFWDLFRAKPGKERFKERIFEDVELASRKPHCKGLAFRLYETCSGVRVIVLGRPFDAKSKDSVRMMKDFNCDPLYALLCVKQGCFRARLTPKPQRIKVPSFKVVYPRSPEEELALAKWLAGYEESSRAYSACRFVRQLGEAFKPGPAVKYHDEASGAGAKLKLA